MSLGFKRLKRFSYLYNLSVCILFLRSHSSLFSPIFLSLRFYLSVPPSFLYSYLGNNKIYLQFSFCRCPSNGATIHPPVFPEGDRNWQLLMCSSSIFLTVLLQLVSVLQLVLVLLLKQHLALSSTWMKYGLYWTSSQCRKKRLF